MGETFRLLAFPAFDVPDLFRSPAVISGAGSDPFAPQTDFPIITSDFLPFFFFDMRNEEEKRVSFSTAGSLPRSPRHTPAFKTWKGWKPAEHVKVTEAERSRNVHCLFSYFGAVMN